jgi:hypothetical protein
LINDDDMYLSGDAMVEKKVIYAVVAVAIIAVAAVGVYWMFSDKEEKRPYVEYSISGDFSGITFNGYMRMTVLDETEDQIQVKYESKLYMKVPGLQRTTLVDETETKWEDKDGDPDELGTKTGSMTISTKWGDKVVDIYLRTDGGLKFTSYVGQEDEVLYKMISEEIIPNVGLVTLTFELTKTNML